MTLNFLRCTFDICLAGAALIGNNAASDSDRNLRCYSEWQATEKYTPKKTFIRAHLDLAAAQWHTAA